MDRPSILCESIHVQGFVRNARSPSTNAVVQLATLATTSYLALNSSRSVCQIDGLLWDPRMKAGHILHGKHLTGIKATPNSTKCLSIDARGEGLVWKGQCWLSHSTPVRKLLPLPISTTIVGSSLLASISLAVNDSTTESESPLQPMTIAAYY